MKIRHVLLSSAIAVAFATPGSADDLTVSGATTSALTTSAASGGTPGNITIAPAGSVTISTDSAAITIDSNNSAINQGKISNTAASSAKGVNLLGGNTGSFTNLGAILIPGTGTPPSSTGEFGIILNGTGAFVGDIVTGSASSLSISGATAQAITIQTELAGNLTLDGTITAAGATSSAVITTAPIDGAFINRGAIQTVSGSTSTVTVNPQPGITVGFGGSISLGMLNAGPVNSSSNTPAATIKTSGSLAALAIAPTIASDAADLSVGILSDATNSGFSFINRGLIANDGTQPGVPTLAVQIGDPSGDTSGKKTILTGGFYNGGTVRAASTSDNALATGKPRAASDANAILIGIGANVPSIVNAANATIVATTGGPLGGTATALWMQSGASLGTLSNAGTISATAISTDTATGSLAAYAVRDAGGALTQIDNSGVISATASVLSNNAQIAAAVDASASSIPLVFHNSGIVTGDVRLGSSGASQLAIGGAHASLTGSISTLGNGRVAVAVSPNGTGGSLETASVNKASTFAVGSGGTVTFDIGQNATVVGASGAASLDANAHVLLKPVSLVSTGTIALIHSDTGLTINGNLSTITAGATIPFLYTGAIGADAKNLTLTIARKNANELGLTGAAATIYEPAMTAAANDPTLAAALGTLPDAQHVQSALEQFQPVDAGYLRSTAAFLTDPNSDSIGARQRRLTLAPQADGFGFWTGADVDQLSLDGGDGHGFGAAFGVDFSAAKKGHLGIAFTMEETRLNEDVNNAASKATWYFFSPYLGFEGNNVFLNAQLNGGSASVSTHRRVNVGAVNRTSSASPSETLASGGIAGGYIFNYAGWSLAPEVSFSALKMSSLSYAESGGGAGVDLSVRATGLTTVSTFAGVAASSDYEVFGGHLVPQLLAGWNESVDSSGAKMAANFVSQPNAGFALTGPQRELSGFLGAADLDFGNDYTMISLGYDGTVGGKTNVQSAHLRVSGRF